MSILSSTPYISLPPGLPLLLLSDVVSQLYAIPPLPSVVLELLASMDQDDAPLEVLAHKIGQDQALTVRVLRLANSSFYGMSREVQSISQAISVLGFRAVRNVVTTIALLLNATKWGPASIDLLPYQRHTIATAVCASELAAYMQVNPDQAYTAGLLHDIGRVVLILQFAAYYRAVLSHHSTRGGSLVIAERAVLGFDHAQVGQALLLHWRFPADMKEAVANHHLPVTPQTRPLTAVVAAANGLSHTLGLPAEFAGDQAARAAGLALLWAQLGLSEAVGAKVCAAVTARYDSAIRILD